MLITVKMLYDIVLWESIKCSGITNKVLTKSRCHLSQISVGELLYVLRNRFFAERLEMEKAPSASLAWVLGMENM